VRQRTFERVVGIMRKNLERLGIASTFRYVDDSQYQKRVDSRDFDMVSIWWNQGLHYPGNEQYSFWHSSQSAVKGSQNLAGLQNPVIDGLVEKIAQAHSLADLTPAARALDRVLLAMHIVIPHWSVDAWRLVHWNLFGKPRLQPPYNIALDTWWLASKTHPTQREKEQP
jgi:microcin C transport system substrate-binding protein